ncbi:MAG: hypothetical protein GXP49_03480 [Deltaproteobacteria bacterium]|nr:hypothetical protein [Deltaproteobacteria bacterium]
MPKNRSFPLTDEELRSFYRRKIEPIKRKEKTLPQRWKKQFRVSLPYYSLLDEPQQKQIRRLFWFRLPDPDVPIENFTIEELVKLDLLAENYLDQVIAFAPIAMEHDYGLAMTMDRDTPSRFAVLTLSGSIYVLDAPSEKGTRAFKYDNIYGNSSIPPEGTCRLKKNPAVGEKLRTVSFKSSPIMLLACERERGKRPEFKEEALVISEVLCRRTRLVRRRSQDLLFKYLGLADEDHNTGPSPEPGREE